MDDVGNILMTFSSLEHDLLDPSILCRCRFEKMRSGEVSQKLLCEMFYFDGQQWATGRPARGYCAVGAISRQRHARRRVTEQTPKQSRRRRRCLRRYGPCNVSVRRGPDCQTQIYTGPMEGVAYSGTRLLQKSFLWPTHSRMQFLF